jgi:hypothetical protein
MVATLAADMEMPTQDLAVAEFAFIQFKVPALTYRTILAEIAWPMIFDEAYSAGSLSSRHGLKWSDGNSEDVILTLRDQQVRSIPEHKTDIQAIAKACPPAAANRWRRRSCSGGVGSARAILWVLLSRP